MDERDKVYQAGKTAFDEDRDRDLDNPYDPVHPLYLAWDWGWTDRRDEANTIALLDKQGVAAVKTRTIKKEVYSGKLF